jgi:hypothetical protein
MKKAPTSAKFDLGLKLRHARFNTGRAVLRARSVTADNASVPEIGASQTGDAESVSGQAASSVTVTDTTPYVQNADPWKVRIPRRWRTRWERIGKRALALWRKITFQPRPLTPQEARIAEEDKRRLQLERFHMEQATRGSMLLIGAFTRMGFCHSVTREGSFRVRSEVVFDHVKVTPYAYYYHVDGALLPHGVDASKMVEPWVCTNLSISVEHPVRAQIAQINNVITGLTFSIEIAGINGIPNHVSFADMLTMIPASAPPLAFIVGAAANGRTEIRNLADGPHSLIVGETGGGKSNMQNVMIASHISRNTVNGLRVMMIDLKGGGLEAIHWEGIPHLITSEEVPNGIAGTVDQALHVLRYAAYENARRQDVFREHKVKNLDQWNSKFRKRHMPLLVVYLDELALLLEDPQTKKEVLSVIRNISSLGRAGGVHVCAATQSPDRTVLGYQSIKVNFGQRIAFSMPDVSQSIIAIGTGDAAHLPAAEVTPGRAIYKRGASKFEVQTPFISNSDIAQVVANARAGRITSSLATQLVQPEDVIRWAIAENNSMLEVRNVYNEFRNRLELHGVEKLLKTMDEQIYLVDGSAYQVLPGGGRRGRMVVPVESPGPSFSVAKPRDEIRDASHTPVTSDRERKE